MKKIIIIFKIFFCAVPAMAQDYDHFLQEGNNSYLLQNWKEAIQYYSKAYTADIGTLAFYNSANAYFRLNDFKNAIQQYNKITTNKTNTATLRSKAYNNAGLTYIQLQQVDNAVAAFKAALILSPSDNDIRDNLQKAMTDQKFNHSLKKQMTQTPNIQLPNNNRTAQKMKDLQQKEKRSLKKINHGAQQYERNGGKDW